MAGGCKSLPARTWSRSAVPRRPAGFSPFSHFPTAPTRCSVWRVNFLVSCLEQVSFLNHNLLPWVLHLSFQPPLAKVEARPQCLSPEQVLLPSSEPIPRKLSHCAHSEITFFLVLFVRSANHQLPSYGDFSVSCLSPSSPKAPKQKAYLAHWPASRPPRKSSNFFWHHLGLNF